MSYETKLREIRQTAAEFDRVWRLREASTHPKIKHRLERRLEDAAKAVGELLPPPDKIQAYLDKAQDI